ncbi:MAG: sugar phosphate isomerase/epimerase family protein [Phycisphaerae bacterium]
MKLAFSTNAYKKTSLESAIESIGALGYAGVEIMADVPHALPAHMPAQRISAVKAQIEKLRLGISNVNAFTLFAVGDTYHPTWIEDDAAKRQQRIAHTRQCIEMTAALGGKTISLQPGGPLGALDRATALDRYAAGLHEVLPLAQRHGITLMVEPEPGLVIQTSTECREFLNRAAHPNLKMNCDLGHFFCVDEDPVRVLRECRDIIAHVHLEDIRADRVHQHLIPGKGAMDFAGIFKALGDIGYAGWLTVELYPYETTAEEAARQALAYLEKFM